MSNPSDAPTREHRLKTWPTYFEAIRRREKPFEVRRNDRDYRRGDVLVLREWDPEKRRDGLTEPDGYTPRTLRCTITYVMLGGQFGIDPHYCVLGISDPIEEMCYGRF